MPGINDDGPRIMGFVFQPFNSAFQPRPETALQFRSYGATGIRPDSVDDAHRRESIFTGHVQEHFRFHHGLIDGQPVKVQLGVGCGFKRATASNSGGRARRGAPSGRLFLFKNISEFWFRH